MYIIHIGYISHSNTSIYARLIVCIYYYEYDICPWREVCFCWQQKKVKWIKNKWNDKIAAAHCGPPKYCVSKNVVEEKFPLARMVCMEENEYRSIEICAKHLVVGARVHSKWNWRFRRCSTIAYPMNTMNGIYLHCWLVSQQIYTNLTERNI